MARRLRVRAPAMIKHDCVLVEATLEAVHVPDRLQFTAPVRPERGDAVEIKIELTGGDAVYADLRVEEVVTRGHACLVTARARFPDPASTAAFARWAARHGTPISASAPQLVPIAVKGAQRPAADAPKASAPAFAWLTGLLGWMTG